MMRTIKQGSLLAGITLLFCIVVFMLHSVAPVVEQLLVDIGFAFARTETPDTVVIVGVDGKSISDIGAWPWPRATFASLVERIGQSSPRAVALDFLFPKRIDDPGSDSLAAVFSRTTNLVVGMRLDAVTDNSDMTQAMVTTTAYKHRFFMIKNQDALVTQFPYSAERFSQCVNKTDQPETPGIDSCHPRRQGVLSLVRHCCRGRVSSIDTGAIGA